MVYNTYKKQRILSLYSQGLKAPTIAKILREEGQLRCTRVGVAKFLKKFEETGSLSRRSGSGRPTKITSQNPNDQDYVPSVFPEAYRSKSVNLDSSRKRSERVAVRKEWLQIM